MKGPGFRLDLDVRRVWECPECGRQRRRAGRIVALRCGCTNDGPWMRLVENRPEKPTVPPTDPSEQNEIRKADKTTSDPNKSPANNDRNDPAAGQDAPSATGGPSNTP